MRRAAVIVLALVAGGHVVGGAQRPASPSAPPTFKTGTALVEVSAIVTRDGRPVTDLRADEVTILDNGAPQSLVSFEYVDLARAQGPAQRRDFVLLIDDLHIHPRRTQPAIDASLAVIDALASHDRLAVVHTTLPRDDLDFSTDREAARVLVRATRGQQQLTTPVPGELEARTTLALDVVGRVATRLRADAVERRALLMISEGHPGFTPEWSGSMGRDRQDPPKGKKQPATRSIKVKVSRADLDVRARQRYAPVTGS